MVKWSGRITSVQPRIGLTRSFDQSWHSYDGYVITVANEADAAQWRIGVGPATHAKFGFRVGCHASGEAHSVTDAKREIVELHRASKIRCEPPSPGFAESAPPWIGVAPPR